MLTERLQGNFKEFADRQCLVTDALALTYSEMARASNHWAVELQKNEVGKGNLVGLWLGSSIEFFLAMIALWQLGAVPVVLNPDLRKRQKDEILSRLDLFAIIIGRDYEEESFAQEIRIIEALPMDVSFADEPIKTEINPDDTAAILFTSGSSGMPKGVVLSHRALGGNAVATGKALGLCPDDRWIFNIPFSYTSAICHVFTGMAAGCSVYALDRFCFPDQFILMLNDFKATGFGGSPIQVRWLLDALTGHEDVPSLKKIMSSGDRLLDKVWIDLRRKMPDISFYNTYGLTELGGRFCILDPKEAGHRIGSVGKPIDGLICTVRDPDTDEEFPRREQGEVYAEGDLLMDGYYRLPEQTKSTIVNSRLRTGDIGWQDEEGFLYLVGRSDDVFKSSGEKVSAVLIQQVVAELDCFQDVAVLGVPDEFLGLVPKVYYVLKEGRAFDRKSLLAQLNRKLPQSHVPRLFAEVKLIPRTGSGKVARQQLKSGGAIKAET